MKKSCGLLILAAAMAIGLTSLRTMAQEAQQENSAQHPENRWDGRVVRINMDTSTLDVRKGHVPRTVHFDSSTKWTKTAGKKVVDISPSEVKVSDRVICLGKWNDKKEYWAERIDLRAGKSAL
jgi:hypothetical protein